MKWKIESQRKQYGQARWSSSGRSAETSSCSTRTCRAPPGPRTSPQRSLSGSSTVGIAEQNMMDTAAGLAASGKTVFASTFAVFGTGRCYDQITAVHSLSEAQHQDRRVACGHHRRRRRRVAPDHRGHRAHARPAEHDRHRAGRRPRDVQGHQGRGEDAWAGLCAGRPGGRADDHRPETDRSSSTTPRSCATGRTSRSSAAGSWSSKCLEAAEELAKHGVDARVRQPAHDQAPGREDHRQGGQGDRWRRDRRGALRHDGHGQRGRHVSSSRTSMCR